MAPKKPQRTPRISTGFDKSYKCTNRECEHDILDPDIELDNDTWTCKACDEPVLITLTNSSGRTVYVTRCQAREVVKNNSIYLEYDISNPRRVLGTHLGTGKINGGKVMLGLQGHGGVYFVLDEYVNLIP